MIKNVKSIYKITNSINGKIYIGQAKNVKDRFIAHCTPSSARRGDLVARAIQKYGKENFIFEIIEKDIENYNERERYWIKYYNCLIPNGYNIQEGGNSEFEVPSLQGENNPFSIYTKKQIETVINLLKETKLSYPEIADLTGVNQISTIGYINAGKQWKNKNIKYPIRQNKENEINEKLPKIITLLKNPEYTLNEIEKETGIGHTTIYKINFGEIYNIADIKYPIRPKEFCGAHCGKNYKAYLKKKIIAQDIKNTNLSFKEISKKNNCCLSTVYNINNGKSKIDGENYPLRKLGK